MVNMYRLNICGKCTSNSNVNDCKGTKTYTEIDPLYHPLDIYEFAEWAFSAEGLPDLTVLAWGDFSHEGHFSEHNNIFCRSKTGYRRLKASEISLWDLINDNMDMLAACPYTDTNVLSRIDFL